MGPCPYRSLHLKLPPITIFLCPSATEMLFLQAFPDLKKYLFLERQEEGESEREREKDTAMVTSQPGTKPATQACALTGNRTGDLLMNGMMAQPTVPCGQGTFPDF